MAYVKIPGVTDKPTNEINSSNPVSVVAAQKPKESNTGNILFVLGLVWIVVGMFATVALCMYTAEDSSYGDETHPWIAFGLANGFVMFSFGALFISLSLFMEKTVVNTNLIKAKLFEIKLESATTTSEIIHD